MQEHSDNTMDFPSFIELKLAERVATLAEELSSKDILVEEFRQLKEKVTEEIMELRNEAAALKQQNQLFQNLVAEKKKELDNLNDLINVNKEHSQRLEHLKSMVLDEVIEGQSVFREFEGKNEQIRSEYKRHEELLQKLKEQKNKAEKAFIELLERNAAEYVSAQQKLQRTNAELIEKRNQIRDARTEFLRLAEKQSALLLQHRSLTDETEIVQQKLAHTTALYNQLYQESDKLSLKLKEAESPALSYFKMVYENERKSSRIENRMKALFTSFQSIFEQGQEDRDKLTQELAELREVLIQLEKKISDKQDALGTLDQDKKQLETESRALTDKITDMITLESSLQYRIDQYKHKLESLDHLSSHFEIDEIRADNETPFYTPAHSGYADDAGTPEQLERRVKELEEKEKVLIEKIERYRERLDRFNDELDHWYSGLSAMGGSGSKENLPLLNKTLPVGGDPEQLKNLIRSISDTPQD